MNSFKPSSIFNARWIGVLAVVVLGLLAACSGGSGGCGSCAVPAYHATPPGATPLPPGVTPTPSPTPTPVGATPTPTPTATPAVLSCSQGGPTSIALGPALAPFALLAGSTISNVGTTVVTYSPGAVTGGINDDLIGVSPGTAVTGFYPPGSDTDGSNAIYAAGYNTNAAVPLAAENALTTAYNTAAGEPVTTTFLGGQDLSQASVPGHPVGTLPPGVYHSPSSLAIAAGNLTLDGGGSAQSVFIFQMGSTLTTTLNGGTSGNVILTNGASPCNIYWQVGSSATLGGATFYGNVLAFSSVTINASIFTGRALAGGPTLGDGAVSVPILTGSLITNPGGN